MPSTTAHAAPFAEEIPLPSELPELPVQPSEFLGYVNENPDVPIRKLLEPFLAYESVLRAYFAQNPDNALVQGYVGLISLFENGNADLAKIRARDLAGESTEERERYVMPLKDEVRKANGAPAIVSSLEEFRNNFNIFSEGSLLNLDWNNVIAAGSSVVTPLLRLPDSCKDSKRAIRGYYHEQLAPASDIDLFIHGIEDEKAALAKMKAIEKTVRDNLLCETTTIRTRNTITIVSQYPNRHVQIVLRLYKSIAQILTGFDVNCACVAYDGSRVWTNPRSIVSYMTQCNDIDLTRRSPSYENRLSKYSHRGFEVYCPFLDRSKVDPTIFERSFNRTKGLARLLVLERLPKPDDRNQYVLQRKREKGRPVRNNYHTHKNSGNLKSGDTDEVAEWNFEDESGYQKFSIPYGKAWYATKIEKFFYQKDMLLNAEWNPVNKPPHRTVNLHRHPVFFGTVEEVAGDCCGFCPEPTDDEERKVQEEEDKIYVRRSIQFMKEDPGRQEIGSFYPLGPEDYTDMAYVGSTELLCHAIINNDADYVRRWCLQEDANVNRRDFCGRTPLQLAVLSTSTDIEVVQALIDNGARLIARLQDGRTALHLAAARGSVEMVRALLKKSVENEHERDLREEAQKSMERTRKEKEKRAKERESQKADRMDTDSENEDSDENFDEISEDDSEEGIARTSTTSSFIKIKKPEIAENILDDAEELEDDIYDINVIDWDFTMSPLHHAIMGGHVDVIRTLVSDYGADLLLPIKILNYEKSPVDAILSLCLVHNLPKEKAIATAATLLQLGASSAQANSFTRVSALHYAVWYEAQDIVELMFDIDGPAASSIINQLGKDGSMYWTRACASPLATALQKKSAQLANFLLDRGARGKVTLDEFMTAAGYTHNDSLENARDQFEGNIRQPIEHAIWNENALPLIGRLLAAGADPSTITMRTYNTLGRNRYPYYNGGTPAGGMTVLDLVRARIERYREYLAKEEIEAQKEPQPLWDRSALDKFPEGSYSRFVAEKSFELQNNAITNRNNALVKRKKEDWEAAALEKKKAAAREKLELYEKAEKHLLDLGAKTYDEINAEKGLPAPPLPSILNPAWCHPSGNPEEPKEFTVPFNFPDLVSKHDGYKALFEAVWSGDAHTIKKLTLGPSGEGEDKISALRISLKDMNGLSTLAIALHRGHRDIAKLILDIAQTQFHVPQATTTEKYVMRDDNDDEARYGDDDYDESDMQIYKRLIDDEFTIENLGARSDLVKCTVSPLDLINFRFDAGLFMEKPDTSFDTIKQWTVLTMAIYNNDLDLLKYILKLASEVENGDPYKLCHLGAIEVAVRLNRISILEELMKTCSFSINYEALEEEENESDEAKMGKPKYYAGLTVHGRKRKEWAKQANPGYSRSHDWHNKKFVEIAAYYGCLESLKWLLSEKPLACLQHFMKSNHEETRVKLLNKQGPRLAELLRSRLGADSKLLPHLLLHGWTADSLDTFNFLMTEIGLSEAKCDHGNTPVLYAARLLRKNALKYMAQPKVGVNFAARDTHGRNIVHKLLTGWNECLRSYDPSKELDGLTEFLNIVPENILSEAWCQRTFNLNLTPLASYLSNIGALHIPTVKLILQYSTGEDLKVPDGEGNWPIHTLFQKGYAKVAQVVLEMSPEMIFKENSVGRTPIEIATDQYLIHVVSNPPRVVHPENVYCTSTGHSMVIDKHLVEFRETEPEESEYDQPNTEAIYKLALKMAGEWTAGKRSLVNLLDANELAKRAANNWHLKRTYELTSDEPSACSNFHRSNYTEVK